MALPDDFKWRRWTGDDMALTYEGRNIALVCPLDNGRVRIGINCNTDRTRYVFAATMVVAIRYVEAWASKWAPEIRELHGSGRGILFRP